MLIVILIGLAFIGVIVGLKVLDNETDWDVDIFRFIVLVLTISYWLLVPICFYSSNKEAELINKTYSTSYTAGDIFWTGGIIKDYLLGEKKRVEVSVEEKE